MFQYPINGFYIPAGVEVVTQFKVRLKRGCWRWVGANIMTGIFK